MMALFEWFVVLLTQLSNMTIGELARTIVALVLALFAVIAPLIVATILVCSGNTGPGGVLGICWLVVVGLLVIVLGLYGLFLTLIYLGFAFLVLIAMFGLLFWGFGVSFTDLAGRGSRGRG